MDLTLRLSGSILNIRVVALIRNELGYIFERADSGFYVSVGGRVKLNESSEDALKREVFEELNLEIKSFKLLSIIESFFEKGPYSTSVHEINFVYLVDDVYSKELPKNFISILPDDFAKYDIRPTSIIDVLRDRNLPFVHIIQK